MQRPILIVECLLLLLGTAESFLAPTAIYNKKPSRVTALHVSLSTTWGRGGYATPSNSTAVGNVFDYQQQAPQSISVAAPTTKTGRFQVYCDLDGVLVDFEGGIRQLFPDCNFPTAFQMQDLSHKREMWKQVAQAGAFFERLDWTSEGRHLWQAIQHLEPDILTGVPFSYRQSRAEKLAWCRRELGVDVSHIDMADMFCRHASVNGAVPRQDVCNVITCWSDNKHHHSGPGAVLIDDRACLRPAWEEAGGIFIHHNTGDVVATLQQLKDHGILFDEYEGRF